MAKKEMCRLCGKGDVGSGKDALLYEDSFCYIVDNGNTHLKIDGKLRFAKRRMSLIIKEHKSILEKGKEDLLYSTFEKFMRDKLGMELDKDYFFRCTMGTYSEHYHTHAYILPFGDKGRIK